MARTGRPKKEIDQDQFEKLCALQCPLDEVADFFDCSQDTVENWCKRTYQDDDGKPMTFSKVFAIKRGKGKISLRRAQFELAKKNAAMAIFLGKQYLGQSDQPVQDGKTGEILASLQALIREDKDEVLT